MPPSNQQFDLNRRAARDGRVDAGRLVDVSVAELLAHGRNTAFTGALLFRPTGGERLTLGFERGVIIGASGPWEVGPEVRKSLLELLPEEQLQLAEAHAHKHQLLLLSAVEHLCLLPPGSLTTARAALIMRAIEFLARLPKDTRFAFVERPAPPKSAYGPRVDVIRVLLGTGSAELSNGKARRYVDSLQERPVRIADGQLRGILDAVSGPSRAVVSALGRPQTVRQLVEGTIATNEQVTQVLFGLWLTHQLAVGDLRSWSGPPPMNPLPQVSGTRRLSLPESVRPSMHTGERGRSRPASSHVSSSATMSWAPESKGGVLGVSPAEAAARENAVEKRVLQAWMAAESNSDRTERAASFTRKAAALYPKNARIQFFAARLDAQTDRLNSAEQRFKVVLQLEPGNADARRELERVQEALEQPSHRAFSIKDWFGSGKD